MNEEPKILKTIDDAMIELSGVRMCNRRFISEKNNYSIIRSDRKFVQSLAKQALGNELQAWTEKQKQAAYRMIKKYQNQLDRNDRPVQHLIESPRYARKARGMDYASEVNVVDEKFVVKFPFDAEIVGKFKKKSKQNQSIMEFDVRAKTWTLALREDMLVFLMGFPSIIPSDQIKEWMAQAQEIIDKAE